MGFIQRLPSLHRLRRVLWATVVVAAVAAIGLAVYRAHQNDLARRGASAAGDYPSVLAGRPLPPLRLTDLDNHPVSPDQFHGRPVMLNFWATWCIPCRSEMPDIEREWRAWKGRVEIVGVDDGESASPIRSFAHEVGVSYPLWRGPTATVDRLVQAPGLPYPIFLARTGTVRRIYL